MTSTGGGIAAGRKPEVWFLTGSQHLYGPEVLDQVAANAADIVRVLDSSEAVPVRVVTKPVLTESAATPQGGRFHGEAWLRHNAPAGAYELQLEAITADGRQTPISLPLPARPDEWQKLPLD